MHCPRRSHDAFSIASKLIVPTARWRKDTLSQEYHVDRDLVRASLISNAVSYMAVR